MKLQLYSFPFQINILLPHKKAVSSQQRTLAKKGSQGSSGGGHSSYLMPKVGGPGWDPTLSTLTVGSPITRMHSNAPPCLAELLHCSYHLANALGTETQLIPALATFLFSQRTNLIDPHCQQESTTLNANCPHKFCRGHGRGRDAGLHAMGTLRFGNSTWCYRQQLDAGTALLVVTAVARDLQVSSRVT